jgi:predicted protein tyrosine phosphatase
MKKYRNRIVQSLKRAYGWLAYRPLHLTGLRVYEQVARLITGAPIRRYSEVLPLLHVGGQQYPKGMAELEARGIRAVVNLRKEFDDTAAGVATSNYLHLLITDNTAPTQAQLRSGVDFITEQIEQGNGVYIHCGVGVGRAPTIAAAYLVSTGLTPEEAWVMLRAVRPFIWPNRSQRASIQQFAEELKDWLPVS